MFKFISGLLGVASGGGAVWAGFTSQPQLAGHETHAMAVGGVVALLGLWRMSRAFKSDKKK